MPAPYRVVLLLLVSLSSSQAADKRTMTVDDIMKVRNVLDPRISPDGSEVVYVVSVVDDDKGKYDSDLWLVNVKHGKSIPLTRNPGRDDSPRWSPDGKTIAFVSDRSGSPQLWLLPRAGGEARKASSHATPVGDFAWSPEGKSIAFLARDGDSEEQKKVQRDRGDVNVIDKNRKNSHLHLVDLDTGKSRQLTNGDFHVASFSWSPDGLRIAYAAGPSSSTEDEKDRDLFLLYVPDGHSDVLLKRPGLDTMPRFSPDGKKVAFLSRNGNTDALGDVGLCIATVERGKPIAITSTFTGTLLSGQESVEWDADSNSLYFAATRGTVRHLCKVDARTEGKEVVLTSSTGFEDRFTFSTDGKCVAYLRDDPTTTSEVWFFNRNEVNRLSPRRLTDTNPQLRDLKLGKVELMKWKSKDGLSVEGLLMKPVGFKVGERYPTLVYVHGGPSGQFMQSFTLYGATMPQYARYPLQVMAGEGYAIFCPNPRGSGSYGEKFRISNVKDWGGGDLDDILSGLDELVMQGIADADRLGIMGSSYGGYMTSWTITQTDRFKAASFGAGLTNLTSFYGQTDIPSFLERYWGGTPWEQKDLYEKRSAMTHITKVKTPTLIQHGEKDERVPLAQSQELYAALKKLKVPVEMAVYPRQGHNVTEPRLQRDVMSRNVEWFNRWLKK